MASANSELIKLERALVRLKNKINRADLDFTAQISISSAQPGKVTYAAQMTPPASGLAPITF